MKPQDLAPIPGVGICALVMLAINPVRAQSVIEGSAAATVLKIRRPSHTAARAAMERSITGWPDTLPGALTRTPF